MDKITVKYYDELHIIDNFITQKQDNSFVKVTAIYPTFKEHVNLLPMSDLFIKAKLIGGIFGFCNKTPNSDIKESSDTKDNEIGLMQMSSAILLGKLDLFD